MLSATFPGKSLEDLAALPIGLRDAYLLTLREATIGPKLDGFTECPQCGERLEFQLSISDIRVIDPTQPLAMEHQFHTEGFEIQFRVPNSWDLAAIVPYKETQKADAILLERCVLKATHRGRSVQVEDLPEAIQIQLTEQMAEADPQAELWLNLQCAACGHEWRSLFDIVSFFWTELNSQAKRLVREVHTLAHCYGWREADILAMTTKRRQMYLDLVAGD